MLCPHQFPTHLQYVATYFDHGFQIVTPSIMISISESDLIHFQDRDGIFGTYLNVRHKIEFYNQCKSLCSKSVWFEHSIQTHVRFVNNLLNQILLSAPLRSRFYLRILLWQLETWRAWRMAELPDKRQITIESTTNTLNYLWPTRMWSILHGGSHWGLSS